MDHAPGTPARPDVTAAGDAEVTPMLDAAQADLSALAGQVEALGSQARGALAALNSLDSAGSDAAIADGDRLVADVIARTAAPRPTWPSVPYVGTPTAALTVSDAVVARHAALVAALDATDGLDAAWARLTIGSVAASRMSAALAEHDRLVVAATQDGRLAKYASAMKLLDKAEAQIAAAREGARRPRPDRGRVRARPVARAQPGVRRRAAQSVQGDLEGRQEGQPATKAAVKAEAAARARLPPDTRGLIIIMSEIGRGGMNGAVIAIEEARAKLTDAIDAGRPRRATARSPPAAPDRSRSA